MSQMDFSHKASDVVKKTRYQKSAVGYQKYIRGLDGLRAIAVLIVLAYHLQIPFARGGLIGVTVFFVISGFLITRILLSELESAGTVNLKEFWIRRIRRLFPAIIAMLIVLIFVSAIFNRVLFTKACQDLFSVIFCYNNWWQIFNHVSYFENAGAPSPLTHCWSLAIEAQFYLVYPLLLMVLFKIGKRKYIPFVTVLLTIVSAALMWIMFDPSQDPSRVYYGTDTRAFSLLFGALLAIRSQYGKQNLISCTLREKIGAVSLVGILCITGFVDGYSSFFYRGGHVLVSFLAVLVIYAVLDKRSILGAVLGLPPLKWIGERSYGIYLWHYPIILLLSGGKSAPWWLSLIEVLLTLLLSELSYRLVETPIRHGIIRKSIAFITSHPRSRRERIQVVSVLRRMMKVCIGTSTIILAAILCIIFVPKEQALSNIEELEAQAQKASETAKEKAEQAEDNSGNTEDDTQGDLSETEDEILSNLQLLLIGDSVALGTVDEFYSVFPNSICDAAISRYTTESYDIYDAYVNDQGWNGDGVIFALGTNGLMYDSLPTLRERMGADLPLFIITVRAPYATWEDSNNQEMHEFVKANPNTYLIDWYTASEGHSEYFDGDEMHVNSTGAQAFIDCIKNAVLPVYE